MQRHEANPVRVTVVVRRDHAAFPRRQVLGRVEAEARERAQRADHPAFVARRNGMRGVLDHDQPTLARDLLDRIHVTDLTREVHRDDRFRPRGDRSLDRAGIDIQRLGIAIHENRTGFEMLGHIGGRRECHRARDHFVARPLVSNSLTFRPVVSQPERRHSRTPWISPSPKRGAENGRNDSLIVRDLILMSFSVGACGAGVSVAPGPISDRRCGSNERPRP